MITIHCFIEAYRRYQSGRQPYRLLQDQALILINSCRTTYRPIADAFDITDADIDWVRRQPEATEDYADMFGGDVSICETPEDLQQIVGMNMDWANTHDGKWPNVVDLPMAWDSCTYLTEKSGDPQWVLFLLCWNDAGGPVYYVPKSLWQAARVVEHMAATNQCGDLDSDS